MATYCLASGMFVHVAVKLFASLLGLAVPCMLDAEVDTLHACVCKCWR